MALPNRQVVMVSTVQKSFRIPRRSRSRRGNHHEASRIFLIQKISLKLIARLM